MDDNSGYQRDRYRGGDDYRGGRNNNYGGGNRDYGDRPRYNDRGPRQNNYGGDNDRGYGGQRPRYNNRDRDFGGGDRGDGYGGGYRNQGGYQERRNYDRQPYERFNKEAINPNSNYRLYYQNDPEFFSQTIEFEVSPFHFKIHLFNQNRADITDEQNLDSRDDRVILHDFLKTFDA